MGFKTLPSNFPSHQQLLGFQNESNMAMNVDHETQQDIYMFIMEALILNYLLIF